MLEQLNASISAYKLSIKRKLRDQNLCSLNYEINKEVYTNIFDTISYLEMVSNGIINNK